MTSTYANGESTANSWSGHRAVAGALRAAIVAGPLVLSVVAGVVVGWSVTGNAIIDIVGRVLAAGLASVAVFVVFEWLARQLLPLAVLLRLSLVFPDRAPSRFSVALRSTSVRRLRDWARSHDEQLGEQELAEKVLTLASALNFHDRRTRGHSERTRALAELVIGELGLSEAEANEVRWGAFLHDIGKLLVPSAILNKPGAPSPVEWEEIKRHPAEGERLVHLLRPFLGSGVDAVASHHESFDGSGYPAGLRGEEIPLAARIVAVADSFEVMTAVRSYKRPMSATAARQELVRESGKQFDPRVVRAFVNVSLGRLHWALGVAAWLSELPLIGVVPRAAAQVGAVVGAGSGAVSTATLASVATASLGATLMANPLASVPATASASQPAAVSVAAGTVAGAVSPASVLTTGPPAKGLTTTGSPGLGPTGTGPPAKGLTTTGSPGLGPTGTGPPAKGLTTTGSPGLGPTGTGPPAKGLTTTGSPGLGPTGTGPPAKGLTTAVQPASGLAAGLQAKAPTGTGSPPASVPTTAGGPGTATSGNAAAATTTTGGRSALVLSATTPGTAAPSGATSTGKATSTGTGTTPSGSATSKR